MARFDGVDDWLINTAPALSATGVPFTFGIWVRPTALPSTSFSSAVQYTDTGALPPAGRFDIRYQNTGKLTIFARNTTTTANGTTTASAVNGEWHYIIARFITATNRRMAVLFPDGSIEHVQNTTNIVVSGLDTLAIGATVNTGLVGTDFWPGDLAERFIADADIQADGGQLSDALLRQLAYYGPFSVPHIRQSIIGYDKLRSSLPSARAMAEEHYVRGSMDTGTWTNNGGVSLGQHPPGQFEPPHSRSSLVTI